MSRIRDLMEGDGPAWVAAALAILLGVVLAGPGVGGWDGPELVWGAWSLGVSHPPGQPAYMQGARVLSLLPVGDIAFRATLLSVVCGAAFAAGVVRLAQLIGLSGGAALLAGVGSTCSAGVLVQATRAEVYGPAFALLVWALATSDRPRRSSLFWALSLPVHHAMAVAVLPALLWRWSSGEGRSALFVGALSGVVLMQGNWLFLPIRGRVGDGLQWAPVDELGSFLWHISGSGYARSFQAGTERFLQNVQAHLVLGWDQLLLLLPLGFAGLAWLLWRQRSDGVMLCLAVFGTAGLTIAQGVFDPANPDAWAYLGVAFAGLWIGGAAFLACCLPPRWRRAGQAVGWSLPLFALLTALASGAAPGWGAWTWSRSLLSEAPHGAILVGSGDATALPPLYAQGVEGFRQDVRFLNRFALGPERLLAAGVDAVGPAWPTDLPEARLASLLTAQQEGRLQDVLLAGGMAPPGWSAERSPHFAWSSFRSRSPSGSRDWLSLFEADPRWSNDRAARMLVRRRSLELAGYAWLRGDRRCAERWLLVGASHDERRDTYVTWAALLARDGRWGGLGSRPVRTPEVVFPACPSPQEASLVFPAPPPAMLEVDGLVADYRFGDAHAALEDILFATPSDRPADRAVVMERIGRTMFYAGDFQGAAGSWRTCLDLSPVHPGCIQGLERLRAEGL